MLRLVVGEVVTLHLHQQPQLDLDSAEPLPHSETMAALVPACSAPPDLRLRPLPELGSSSIPPVFVSPWLKFVFV